MTKTRAALLIGAVMMTALVRADAAVTPNSIVTAQAVGMGFTHFVQGTDVAGTYKTVYTGTTNGSKVIGVYVTSSDGSASHLLTLQYQPTGGTHCGTNACYGGAAVTIPISSGLANAVPAVNMLAPANWPGLPIDSDGNPYIFLKNGDTLEATFATALTASTLINVVAVAADF